MFLNRHVVEKPPFPYDIQAPESSEPDDRQALGQGLRMGSEQRGQEYSKGRDMH